MTDITRIRYRMDDTNKVMRAPGIAIPLASRRRHGSTLVVVLVVMVVLTALGTAMGAIALNANRDAQRLVQRRQAQVAAEFGVQAAMTALNGAESLAEVLGTAPASTPKHGTVSDACYAYYFQDFEEGTSTVPVQVIGLSPGTPSCVDDGVNNRGRFRMLANVKVAPALLNYSLGGNDLWLGTSP